MATTKNAPSEIKMGYGGFCGVDWKTSSLVQQSPTTISQEKLSSAHRVFITGGNVSLQFNRPQQNTYLAPRDTRSAVPILLSPGTAQISGSINFDMSHDNLLYFLNQNRLKRNTYFNLVMSSGEDTIVVYQNMWNSFSINASAGGLVTCSIGYMSLNKFKPQISTENLTFTDGNYFDRSLVAYWQAGVDDYIESFSINLSQDVTPIYLNNDKIMPSYLRSGSLKLNANIQSCITWGNISKATKVPSSSASSYDFSFYIGSKIFTIHNSFVNTQQYSHSGAGDVGKYSYSIQSIALSDPQVTLFTITSKD